MLGGGETDFLFLAGGEADLFLAAGDGDLFFSGFFAGEPFFLSTFLSSSRLSESFLSVGFFFLEDFFLSKKKRFSLQKKNNYNMSNFKRVSNTFFEPTRWRLIYLGSFHNL